MTMSTSSQSPIDYNQIASEYAQHRRTHPGVLTSLLAVIDQDAAVLEVGCGTGNYSIALQAQTGCQSWGIDPSEAMLTTAQARSEVVQFKQGQAERLDFPANRFDLVFSVDVIHHVRDRAAFFAEAFRVLKPGGQLCTVTDSADVIRRRRPLSNYFPETVAVELERYPRIAALRSLMETAGFQDVAEREVSFAYDLHDIQPYQDKAFSSLHLISDAAHEKGMRQMAQDLAGGPISGLSVYTLLWGEK